MVVTTVLLNRDWSDQVYREADLMSPPAQGVSTTLVPSGEVEAGAHVLLMCDTTGALTLRSLR